MWAKLQLAAAPVLASVIDYWASLVEQIYH